MFFRTKEISIVLDAILSMHMMASALEMSLALMKTSPTTFDPSMYRDVEIALAFYRGETKE